MPLTKRFKRRSVNFDDLNFRRAQTLAHRYGHLRVGGAQKFLVSRAFAEYENQNRLNSMKVW